MNQTIRFDLYPLDIVPVTEKVKARDLKVGDFIWLSYCSVPTFARIGKVERHEDGSVSILDLDGNGGAYSRENLDWIEERIVMPITLRDRSAR